MAKHKFRFDWKNTDWVGWLTLLGIITTVVLLTLSLNKLDKKEKFETKDMGPIGAGPNRVTPPGNGFVESCKKSFDIINDDETLCADDGKFMAQNVDDMDDKTCQGAEYIMYQKSDCENPLSGGVGYLCGGGNKEPIEGGGMGYICAQNTASAFAKAPPNPWGCEYVCQ